MASEMASNFTPWLTLAIFVPIAFGLIILAIGNDQRAGVGANDAHPAVTIDLQRPCASAERSGRTPGARAL